ncbi:hypothetical protein [Allohahella marinimesophila]|uniref:Sulfotransferase family protein n=1 Tax=Allohahella marinimesophila TaxID=1054972 RepID=A0ABP7NFH1_9GAMM
METRKQPQSPRTLHLHIGIPKTASTWLQSKVFPSLDHLRYLDCPRNSLFERPEDQDSDRLMASVFKRSSHIWAGFGDTIFQHLVGDRDAWLADGRSLLISEEGIGRQGSRPALIAAHIREMHNSAAAWGFDQINVVCLYRRQDYWLASHYAQMSDRNPNPGQADFERLVHDVTSPRVSRYGFGMLLDYSELHNQLVEVVGPEGLLMLPYELLQDSPDLLLHSMLETLETPAEKMRDIISGTLGTTANVRSQDGVWRLRRHRVRRLAGVPLCSWPLKPRAKTIELTPEIARQVREAYAVGNRELADSTAVDLGKYGYFDFAEPPAYGG